MNGPARTYDWPSLIVDEWTATRDTLHMWVQIVGKIRVRGAAEVLNCRSSTVRYRLRRIERRTGRSLSRPRDVAEPCLAFEVHRRLCSRNPLALLTSGGLRR